jgi:hypothetical protein
MQKTDENNETENGKGEILRVLEFASKLIV